MRVAVTSQNFRTVTPHAGRCRRFLIFEVTDDEAPVEIGRLDLPLEMAFAEFAEDRSHPVDGVDMLVAGSMGDGFAERMARRGILAIQTDETDPIAAVRLAAASSGSRPAAPATVTPLTGHHCGHHHDRKPTEASSSGHPAGGGRRRRRHPSAGA